MARARRDAVTDRRHARPLASVEKRLAIIMKARRIPAQVLAYEMLDAC